MRRLSLPSPYWKATTVAGIGAIVVAGLRGRLIWPTVPEKVHCHGLCKTKAIYLHQQRIVLAITMRFLSHQNAPTTAAFDACVKVDMMHAEVNATTLAMDVPAESRLADDKLQAIYIL